VHEVTPSAYSSSEQQPSAMLCKSNVQIRNVC
jgi:hypothetical protein